MNYLNEKIIKKNNNVILSSSNPINHDSNFILKSKKETDQSEIKKNQFKSQSKRKCIDEVFPQINLKKELLNHLNNRINNNNNNNNNNNERFGSYSSNCFSSESSNEYDGLNDIDYPLEKLNILY